ncbi:MAG: BrnT family toxin [Caldilineaceae bacterium]|nr:BrnT family toxin [Caldilineaceae bacterium]
MDFHFQRRGTLFAWDENKARTNERDHAVTFQEAAEVFFDPFYQLGDASRNNESRQFIIGYSTTLRLLLVVYMERGTTIRLISARRATRQERMLYEEGT